MAVSCTSAVLPRHSQRLSRGAESTATGWRNSFFDIRYPPSSCYWLVKNNVTNTYRGNPYLVVNDSGGSTTIRQIQKTRIIAQELRRSLRSTTYRSVLLHAGHPAISRCIYTI